MGDSLRRLVFICDGAVWIWNLIAQYFPNAIQIVDWYHAADRLKRIAEEAFPNLEERQAWLKQVTEDLWQGKVEGVMEACRPLAKKSQWAKQSLTYHHNNLERMCYAPFRASGFLIGSGIIEVVANKSLPRASPRPDALLENSPVPDGVWRAQF